METKKEVERKEGERKKKRERETFA